MTINLTVNYSLKMPVPGTEIDLWGIPLNDNCVIIDTQMKANADAAAAANTLAGTANTTANTANATANAAMPKAGGTFTGPVINSSTLTQTGAATFGSTVALNADPSTALQAATKQYVDNKVPGAGTVTNAMLATMPANTMHGNATAGVASPTNLTATQARTNMQVDKSGVLTGYNLQNTNYQPVLADAGKLVDMSAAGALVLTVPANASVAYDLNTRIDLIRSGAGTVTVTPAGGVTVLSANAVLTLRNQYSGATLIKIGTNTWYLVGDLG